MVAYIGTAAVCAALSVLFFLGKGTFLVRGTAGAADTQTFYHAARLRIVCGVGTALLSVLLGVCAVFLDKLPFWLPLACTALICFILILLCNTFCALPQPEPWYRRTAGMFFFGLCIALVFVLSVFGKSGTVTVTPGADSFTVHGSFGSTQTVAYDHVQSITLETGWDNGTRLRGTVGTQCSEGRFHNDLAGDYTMYAYTQCDARVLIRADDIVLAVNAPTALQTKELYEELSERVEQYAAQ